MAILRTAGLAVALVAGLGTPAARAATAPPHLTDGFGLTVVAQPRWVDANERTFTFTVRTAAVPAYGVLPGQVPGEHVVLVTLPEGYDPATRYPVQYTFHGAGDTPDTARNQQIIERATAGVPLITVLPNGSGRGWYTNWADGSENWETFHLDQLVPFVDANLSTIPTRAGRVVSGHSMGGFGAFHYAEDRPDLFSYVGSFSGGLDLLDPAERLAVVVTEVSPLHGLPPVLPDAIFGVPAPAGAWRAQSPAQHVESLRGMGIAMYAGNGGSLVGDLVQWWIENRARRTAVTTARNLTAAGIPYDFHDYGDGSTWAPGCTGKHNDTACLQADMTDFVRHVMARTR
jgi:S-formylglutathione hydrolase FrmB